MSDGDDLVDALDDDFDDEPTSLRAALDEALRTTPHLPRDRALVMLCRRYADLLDDAYDRLQEHSPDEEDQTREFGRVVALIAKIGPRYEATLDRLGMSPGARPAARGGEPHGVDPAAAELDSLADEAAAERLDYSADLHPAVTPPDP